MEEQNVLDTLRTESPSTTHEDLSAEIACTVERQPGDWVRCRRVGSSTYRCNWLTPEHTTDEEGGVRFLQTYRIRQSRFLRVTKPEGRLFIEDLTIDPARNN